MANNERHHHLDGIRALACALVVFHHSFTSFFSKGFKYLGVPYFSQLFVNFTQSGVELFFVLSGVVILTPYLKNNKEFNTIQYLKRRFIRIYPTYFVALIFGAFVIWINKSYPTWYSEILMPFSYKSTISQISMFSLNSMYYNLSWWSLQIELLFYLLVPIIIHFASYLPKRLTQLFYLTAIVLIGITFLQIFLSNNFPQYYGVEILKLNIVKFLDYPLCFIIGTYLSYNKISKKDSYLFFALGLVLVLSSGFYIPFCHSGFALIYGCFINLSFQNVKLKTFLSKPILVWLGERSYSLFLTHFSTFYLTNFIVSHFTNDRNIIYGVLTRSIGVPFALFIAMCLFYFVERKQAKGLATGSNFWPIRRNAISPNDITLRPSKV